LDRAIGSLLVKPHVLEAPVVIDAVLMQNMAFEVRVPACVGGIVRDDWVGYI
jgi:hypothetical protein